jgi:hypothetical protein
MATYRRIAGTGSTVGSGTGIASPSAPDILAVQSIDTTPDADGSKRKRITVTYAPPDPLGTFQGVWVYLDAPDTSGGLTLADGLTPADGTSAEAGIFEPFEIGFFAHNADSPQLSFNFKAPATAEHWRVYLIAGSSRVHGAPVQYGESGATESHQCVVLPPATELTGREVAPLVRSVALISTSELGWATNPEQIQGESGDQAWRVAVSWEWPTDDQNYQSFGGVNIVLSDGAHQVYIGNVDKGASPQWISAPQVLRTGTTAYTAYIESYNVAGERNTQVDGVTPSVNFSVVRQLGSTGVEYAALAVSDGSHAFVTATPVTGADGTALLSIVGYWTAPSDPQFAGVEIVAKKPDGSYYSVAQGRISPIENQISQPASSQTWRFYLRSIDINGRRNSIVDDLDGSAEAGETPWVDITVGSASGQLNLGKALSSSFATDLAVSGGQLTLGNVSATKIVTGILQVGGGGSKVSIMKNFDTLGSLIGWVGDDTGTSGYVGAWFKQLRIGGSSPSSAQIVADTSGNVTISGSLIVGAVASATSATSASSASSVPAAGVTSGTMGSGVVTQALTVTGSSAGPGGTTVTVSITAANLIKLSESGSSYQTTLNTNGLSASGTISGTSFVSSFFPDSWSLTRGLYVVSNAFSDSSGGIFQIKDTSGTIRVKSGVASSHGYTQYDGSHYALWAGSNAKKSTWGAVALSSGSATVSTGLSAIESAVITVVGSGTGSGTPSEYYSVGGSGGSLSIWSSNASSSQVVCWFAHGSA